MRAKLVEAAASSRSSGAGCSSYLRGIRLAPYASGRSLVAMAGRHQLSIHAAVMHCLARCADSQAPLSSLGEFLEKLAGMGWSGDDVREVEMTVLKLLGKLK